MEGRVLVEKTVSYGGLLIREYVRPADHPGLQLTASASASPSFHVATGPGAHTDAASPQPALLTSGVKRKRVRQRKQQSAAAPAQTLDPPPTPSDGQPPVYGCVSQQVPADTPPGDAPTPASGAQRRAARATNGAPLLHLLTKEELLRMQKDRRRGKDFIPGWRAVVQELKKLGRPVPEGQLKAIQDAYIEVDHASSNGARGGIAGLDVSGPAEQIEEALQPEEVPQFNGGSEYQQPPQEQNGGHHCPQPQEQRQQQPGGLQYGYYQPQPEHYPQQNQHSNPHQQPYPVPQHLDLHEHTEPPPPNPQPQEAVEPPIAQNPSENAAVEQLEPTVPKAPEPSKKPGRQQAIPPGSPEFTLSTPSELQSTMQTLIAESTSFIPTLIACTITLTPTFPLSLPSSPATKTEPATPAQEIALSNLTKDLYRPTSTYLVSLIHSIDGFTWNVRRSGTSSGKWRREWVCNAARGENGFDCQGSIKISITQDTTVVVNYRHHPVHLPARKRGKVEAQDGDAKMEDLFRSWETNGEGGAG